MSESRLKQGGRCRHRESGKVGTIVRHVQGAPWPWYVRWDGYDYHMDDDADETDETPFADGPFSADEIEAVA